MRAPCHPSLPTHLTMPPRRNDPCPCGSGRKYKTCCLQRDLEQEAERFLSVRSGRPPSSEVLFANPETAARLRESARRDRTWEAGAIPLPSTIEAEPEARIVVLMVATRDAVLAMNPLSKLSGEAATVAEAIRGILDEAIHLTGTTPQRLQVIHPDVAMALRPLLEGSGIEVEAQWDYDRLLEPARSMVEDLSGVDLWPPMSKPDTWAAWQLPDTQVAALFRAAAAFYRAAPWTVLSDSIPLAFEPSGESAWCGAIMGQGGEAFGLALYEEPSDLLGLYEGAAIGADGAGAREALGTLRGRVITLLFEEARDLPRPMRREVSRKGWEVAAPSAYPTLVALNTPGGGVTPADVGRLTEALALVPRYLASADGSPGPSTLPEDWTCPESGTEVYPLSGPVSEGAPLSLRPGYVRGPAAQPGAFLALEAGEVEPGPVFQEAYRMGIHVVNAFGASLDQRGMSEATILTHVGNAAEFVSFLVTVEAIPLVGLHERDLRAFLMDWHPRTHEGGLTQARRMPVSLDRFFTFLDRNLGLRCPWAAEILEDRDLIAYRLDSAPSGDVLDPEVRDWRDPYFEEMDARVLRPHLHEIHEALSAMESVQAVNLARELTRSWLLWRDELIEDGFNEASGELVDLLVARQRDWVQSKGIGKPGSQKRL